MSDRTAVPERVSKRAKTARRGGPSGRLVVGEYVGQVAADAAQAVRRAGLRPGLDRSFGCEPELTGLVVAQEPVAGEDLARNGMVTLYVAAPGSAPLDGDAEAPEALEDAPSPAPAAPVQAEVAQAEAVSAPARARRRRKPGRAGHAAPVFDSPPAPVLAGRGAAGEAPAARVAQVPAEEAWDAWEATCSPDGEALDEGVSEERDEEELPHDDLVVHADDVFAGRAGGLPSWRRVYPRRRASAALGVAGGLRARLAEHPRLAKIACAGLAAWLAVGVATALDGHHTRITASVISGVKRPAETHTTKARERTPAPRVRVARPVPRSPRARTPIQHIGVQRPDSAPARVRAPAAAPEGIGQAERAGAQPSSASVPVASAPPPSAASGSPTSASAPPAPAQEQTRGGLFSP